MTDRVGSWTGAPTGWAGSVPDDADPTGGRHVLDRDAALTPIFTTLRRGAWRRSRPRSPGWTLRPVPDPVAQFRDDPHTAPIPVVPVDPYAPASFATAVARLPPSPPVATASETTTWWESPIAADRGGPYDRVGHGPGPSGRGPYGPTGHGAGYAPAAYDSGAYGAAYHPAPYDPAPYDPAPYDPAPYDPAPYDPVGAVPSGPTRVGTSRPRRTRCTTRSRTDRWRTSPRRTDRGCPTSRRRTGRPRTCPPCTASRAGPAGTTP